MRIEDGFQPVCRVLMFSSVALSIKLVSGTLQAPFLEDNAYTSDPVLPSLLKRTLPARYVYTSLAAMANYSPHRS